MVTAAAAKSLQSCLTLCNPIDGSPPGSPIPGILQARTLEWVAISFSYAWKWKVKVKSLSRVRPSATSWTAAFQAPPSMGFSRQEYWSGVPLPSPGNGYKGAQLPFFLVLGSTSVTLVQGLTPVAWGRTQQFVLVPKAWFFLNIWVTHIHTHTYTYKHAHMHCHLSCFICKFLNHCTAYCMVIKIYQASIWWGEMGGEGFLLEKQFQVASCHKCVLVNVHSGNSENM